MKPIFIVLALSMLVFGQEAAQKPNLKTHGKPAAVKELAEPDAPCAAMPRPDGPCGKGMRPEGPGRPDMNPGRPCPPPIPDLTEDQAKQIHKIEIEFRKEIQPVENAVGEAEAKLHTAVTKDAPDMAEVTKIITEIGDYKTKIKIAEIKKQLSVRKLLNDEQRLAFDAPRPAPAPLPPPPGL